MKKTILRVLCGLLALVLVLLLVPAVLIAGGMDGTGEPGGEVLIVLGTTVNGREPSPLLKQRLDAALDYLNTYPEANCIVTGGKGDAENLSEAQCMYNYLTAAGIEPGRITMEDRSTSTVENPLQRLPPLPLRSDRQGCRVHPLPDPRQNGAALPAGPLVPPGDLRPLRISVQLTAKNAAPGRHLLFPTFVLQYPRHGRKESQ